MNWSNIAEYVFNDFLSDAIFTVSICWVSIAKILFSFLGKVMLELLLLRRGVNRVEEVLGRAELHHSSLRV